MSRKYYYIVLIVCFLSQYQWYVEGQHARQAKEQYESARQQLEKCLRKHRRHAHY
jgi:hypothetical protein